MSHRWDSRQQQSKPPPNWFDLRVHKNHHHYHHIIILKPAHWFHFILLYGAKKKDLRGEQVGNKKVFNWLKASKHLVACQHFLSPGATLDSFGWGLNSAAVVNQFPHITLQAHFHSEQFEEQTEDICSGCSAPGASLGKVTNHSHGPTHLIISFNPESERGDVCCSVW